MQTITQGQSDYVDYIIFHVENIACGIDIMQVQEIKRLKELTPVPRSPGYIRGVVNMRGHIVTAIDLRQRLELEPMVVKKNALAIIVPHNEELMGFLVDEVDDVIRTQRSSISIPPGNVTGIQRNVFSGILKLDDTLVVILDKEKIVEPSEFLNSKDQPIS